jgi:mannose/fructose/N-acetylgalactosamine-specific phosphotransferase system component IID
VATFVAWGWVIRVPVLLVVGAVRPEWLDTRSTAAPGWFDGVMGGLVILGLVPSCYAGWRTGRGALQSEPGRRDSLQGYLAWLGITMVGLVIASVVAVEIHPSPLEFGLIFGPVIVAMMACAVIVGMRARTTPHTRRDWLNLGVGIGAMVVLVGLLALGILTGRAASTITAFCLLTIVSMVGLSVGLVVKALRKARGPYRDRGDGR